MEHSEKNLYWVKSFDHHENWFVVSRDQYLAETFFADNHGYELDLVSSELICSAEFEDEQDWNSEAYYPSHEMLLRNDFEIISDDEPRIFWKRGKKFCEGNIIQSVLSEIGAKKSGVYIIEVRSSGLYKIGITKDIHKRLNQLQTSNPYEFYLEEFFITDRNRELENLLHKKYAFNRYKREWFKLNFNELTELRHFARNFIGKPYITFSLEDTISINEEYKAYPKYSTDNDLPF